MARLSKEEREQREAAAACEELATLLAPLVGFDLHLEPIAGVFLKPAAAMSLASAKAAIETLKKTSSTAPRATT